MVAINVRLLSLVALTVSLCACHVTQYRQRTLLQEYGGALKYDTVVIPRTIDYKADVKRPIRTVALLPVADLGNWKVPFLGRARSGCQLHGRARLMDDYFRNVEITRFEIIPAHVSQRILSRGGLIKDYAALLRDYAHSGLLDQERVKRIAGALKADLVLQGSILDCDTMKDNIFTGMRFVFVGFDGHSGKLLWTLYYSAVQTRTDTRFHHSRYLKEKLLRTKRSAGKPWTGTLVIGIVGMTAGVVPLLIGASARGDNTTAYAGLSMVLGSLALATLYEVLNGTHKDTHYEDELEQSRGRQVKEDPQNITKGISEALDEAMSHIATMCIMHNNQATPAPRPVPPAEEPGTLSPYSPKP